VILVVEVNTPKNADLDGVDLRCRPLGFRGMGGDCARKRKCQGNGEDMRHSRTSVSPHVLSLWWWIGAAYYRKKAQGNRTSPLARIRTTVGFGEKPG
jgi:hypothetical protein